MSKARDLANASTALSAVSATELAFLDGVTSAVQTQIDTKFNALPYTVGRFYTGGRLSGGSSSTFPANITYYTPIYISQNYTFPTITILGGSSNTGSGLVRIGIYNIATNVPGTVLIDAGTVATTAGANTYQITINQALTSGWYWLAANCVTASTTNSFAATIAGNPAPQADIGSATLNGVNAVGYSQSVNVSAGFATAASLTAIISAITVGLVA